MSFACIAHTCMLADDGRCGPVSEVAGPAVLGRDSLADEGRGEIGGAGSGAWCISVRARRTILGDDLAC